MTASLADLARAGDVDALAAALSARGGSSADRDLYRWLCAAADFGHDEADDAISDHLECSSMRYDDDGWERVVAHWELACDYLRGADGLPLDLELAEKHLDLAFQHQPGTEVLGGIDIGTATLASAREGLNDDARAVLERALEGHPERRVRHLLARVERLVELSAPEVIIDSERRVLREAMTQLDERGTDPELFARVARAVDG